MPQQQLPSADQAEREVLGACLIDPVAAQLVLDVLHGADFGNSKNRWIWEGIEAVARDGDPVDFVTVSDRMDAAHTLARVGGITALSDLASQTVTSANIQYHARMVHEAAARRQMIVAAQRIAALARDTAVDFDAVSTRAEQELWEATRAVDPGAGPEHWGRVVEEELEALGHPEKLRRPVRTGISSLDGILGGLRPGELTIAAARPGVGKSALLQQVVELQAQDGPVAFYSAEMSAPYLVDRSFAANSGVSSLLIRHRSLTDGDLRKLTDTASQLMARSIYLDTTSTLTTYDIVARSRRLAARVGELNLIAIDYLQFLADTGDRGQTRDEVVGGMTRRLKSLSRELNVPVLVASQLRRAADGKRPSLADLRESGSIEQDADVVLMIYGDEDRHDGELIPRRIEVAKNRQGPVGGVSVFFDARRQRFVAQEITGMDAPREVPKRERKVESQQAWRELAG